MSKFLSVKLRKLEFLLRIFRNTLKLAKSLISAKPNNFDVIAKLHLMNIEHVKLQNNLRNTILQAHANEHRKNFITKHDELSFYSQNGEDGITLKILSMSNIDTGIYVELGAGGYTSNTQILAELGWYGTCFDGNSSDLEIAKKYFTSRRLDLNRTEFVQSWITCENINGLWSSMRLIP